MMSEPTFLLLGYALEHLLASGIIALVVLTLCRTKAIPHGFKAGILLAALLLSVLGPLVSRPDGIGADVAIASRPADAAPARSDGAAAGGIEPDAEDRMAWIPSHIRIGEPAARFLILVWFFGVAWQLARQAKGYGGLRRIVAASKRSHALENEYRHLLRSDVEIRLCASFGPAVAGVLHPKILIPQRLAASLPRDAMRAVILHEASHIRRQDVAAHAFQKVVEALFWWNPTIRWMGASLDVSREVACDIAASRLCETPADYADALLTAIEHIAPSPDVRIASALGVADGLRTLDRRIDGVIEARGPSGATAKLASAAVVLSMAVACIAAEAVSRPLAPMPAVPEPMAIETPEAMVIADRIAAGKNAETAARPSHVDAGSPEVASVAPAASKPKADEQRTAKDEQAVVGKAALSVEERIRRDAANAGEKFRRVASQAERAYRRSASQAEQEYQATTATADETYRRQFAELERVAPGAAFEARLTQASRARSRAASAASGKYGTQMAGASEKYRLQMAAATAEHTMQMKRAKARYESAMKAHRLD